MTAGPIRCTKTLPGVVPGVREEKMNDATKIGDLDLWIDGDGNLEACPEWASNCATITRDEAAKLWPLIKRFAETGRLTEEVEP